VLEELASFSEPVHLAEPPGGDGTLYVVERAGKIRALAPDGKVAAEPFLDLSAEVSTAGEGGLFSLAFAPDYASSGRFYVDYASREGRIVIEELRADPEGGTVKQTARRELVSIPHPNEIHWGGLLMFGPDGELYAGTGDGGPPYPIPATAQDPDGLLGKLLRVDRERGGAAVVALGLRNPWRYSFDRESGDLWIGDVGDFTQEEIDSVPFDELEGANFGWPDLEGTAQTKSDVRAPGSIEPLLTYERSGKPDDPFCAITGGHVVRDPELPSLEGSYLYGDFCEGEVLRLDPDAPGRPRGEPTGLEVPRLVSFAEDVAGHVYAISLEGPVYRLVPG